MAVVMIRGLYTDLFEARLAYIDEILGRNYNAVPMVYPEMFNVRDSDTAYEEMTEITGFKLFEKKPEGEKTGYQSRVQGFDKRVKHDTWSNAAQFSFEVMEDDLDKALVDTIPDLAISARRTIETQAASIWNNAFGSELTADGLSLINSAHLLAGGGTFSNLISGNPDFSQTALESGLNIFNDFRDGQNQLVAIEARKLLAHPDQQWLIKEVLQSEKRSNTAENAINVVNVNRLGIDEVYNRYFTDKDMWFLTADPSQHRVMFYWKREPFSDSTLDFDTRNMKTAMFMRFVAAAFDWRGIVGSAGS